MRRLGLLVLALWMALLLSAQMAAANPWGPRTSSYKGNVVVEGSGELQWHPGGSEATVTATDPKFDQNVVYGYTEWYELVETCTTVGGSYIFVATETTCSAQSKSYPAHRLQTDESCEECRPPKMVVTNTRLTSWCDSNGGDCADNGFKVVAGACAQMSWPVPDSCTYAYVEYHSPAPAVCGVDTCETGPSRS